RVETPEHRGRLTPLRRVVSPEPVLTPELAALCRDLADHYAGTMADLVRLAVPPRHARAERTVPPPTATAGAAPGGGLAADRRRGVRQGSAWGAYPAGPARPRHLGEGRGPAGAWLALPDAGSSGGWPRALAQAVSAARRSGRGSVVVFPDHRDV